MSLSVIESSSTAKAVQRRNLTRVADVQVVAHTDGTPLNGSVTA